LQIVKKQADLIKATKKGSIEEGFARLDALTRIGNQVFGIAGGKDANYLPIVAPVSYPHIWNTSWFTWVQYDGSILQPMVRNAGEALGVVAAVNLTGKGDAAFESSVNFETLHAMETQLAGTKPPLPNKAFDGLQSPKWPENVLGKIDPAKAEAGRALYEKLCQGCHLPAPNTTAFWDDKHWVSLPGSKQRYLDVQLIELDEIGTDPAQAQVLGSRKVDTTGMGINTKVWLPDAPKVPAGEKYKSLGACKESATLTDGPALDYGAALGAVVQQTINRWYAKSGLSKDKQLEFDGDRPNCLNPYPMYKARPLNGVWSTPPFLHNGSIPSLDALLSPASERPVKFWLGNLEFDPKVVGLVSSKIKGGTEIDTSIPGNRNTGHEFDDKPKGSKGVIGPRLKPEERAAVIEYLKTL
jgi:mono/diheme cytochrome c family protein